MSYLPLFTVTTCNKEEIFLTSLVFKHLIALLQLVLHQIIVVSMQLDESVVVSAFHYLSVFHHQDLIGVSHRTQAMSHNNHRSALVEEVEVLHYHALIERIERVGSLVQKEIVRILAHCSCYQDTLLLSLAQSHSVSANLGVKL